MNKIEIRTAHNINIQYTLATVWDRILAWIIDTLILLLFSSLVGVLASLSELIFYIILFPVISFYHLFMEIVLNGQSLGKKLFKIKVVSLDGQNPEKQDYLLRWTFRLIDITLTAGSCASILILSGTRNQRIGDILANTTVIKLQSAQTSSLASIKQIGQKVYVPKYPALRSYNDKDMLLVKQALIRFKKYPTDKNRGLLDHLAEDIIAFLRLDPTQIGSKSVFLKQVLEDYIFLTR